MAFTFTWTELVSGAGVMTSAWTALSDAFDKVIQLTLTMLMSLFTFFTTYFVEVIGAMLVIVIIRTLYKWVRQKLGFY